MTASRIPQAPLPAALVCMAGVRTIRAWHSAGDYRLAEQIRRGDPERNGELFDDGDGGVSGATLDVGDIGAVDVRFEGELLLAPTFLLAQAAQVPTEAMTNVHIA